MRMRLHLPVAVLAAVAATALGAGHAAAQTTVTFNVAGPADWNQGANWDLANVPAAAFNETVVVGGARSAFVADTPPDVGGIAIDGGTLEIRPGGSLTAIAGPPVNDQVVTFGNLSVGGGGNTASLIVRRGGTLNVQNITSGGAAETQITLGETTGSGTAALEVAGGTLNRFTRVVGPNVSFTSSGDLAFGGTSTLAPVITGATHSAINVAGTATLGGTVRPEFNGVTPALGNSWTLVTTGRINGDMTVNSAGAPTPPRGAGYVVTKTATTATLRYTNLLMLSVDRATGATKIQNVVGAPISFEGYTIAAPGGNLTGSWMSLQDQTLAGWEEADNANGSRLTEFKRMAPASLNVGASLNLGNPYVPITPTVFGQQTPENVTFQYAVPGQGTLTGLVEFTGRRNNLVLTIDPATGAAAIQNESPFFNVSLDAYTITSATSKLKVGAGGWNSLDDQNLVGWEEADNAGAARITEFNPSGSTFLAGAGTVLSLGAALDVTGGAPEISSLGFQFKLSTGQVLPGIVNYGTLPTTTPKIGDADGDFDADGADFLAWQRTLGANVAPGTGADWSNNGTINAADLALWRTNFGTPSAAAATAGAAAVPEPASWALAVMLLGCASMRGRRRPPASFKGGL